MITFWSCIKESPFSQYIQNVPGVILVMFYKCKLNSALNSYSKRFGSVPVKGKSFFSPFLERKMIDHLHLLTNKLPLAVRTQSAENRKEGKTFSSPRNHNDKVGRGGNW